MTPTPKKCSYCEEKSYKQSFGREPSNTAIDNHCSCSPTPKPAWEKFREGTTIALKCAIAPYSTDFAKTWPEFTIAEALDSIELYANLLIQDTLASQRDELRKKIEGKSEVRTAEPDGEYERGYDHGYDDKTRELLTSLASLDSQDKPGNTT